MFDEALRKIADEINKKRRQQLLTHFFTNSLYKNTLTNIRKQGFFQKGSKSKVWRKIASLPPEVDEFFTRIYGEDYYKDKKFFDKYPEWKTVETI
jgi:hypothetical protein